MSFPFTNMTDICSVLNESNMASRWDRLV